jgi:hypothetical protein
MRYTDTDTANPFDTGDRAWRRFAEVTSDHFNLATWTREDGRPILMSVCDLASGDVFTVAVLDSLEMHQPHALLACHRDGTIIVHGPFDGPAAAQHHASTLAVNDTSIAATIALPLHHPSNDHLPADDTWRPLPLLPLDTTTPQADAPSPAALVLIDPIRQRLAAIGPFPHHNTALRWVRRQTLPSASVECVVTAMHLMVAAKPFGEDLDG